MPVTEVARETPVLRYEFKNTEPLTLDALTNAMSGLSGAYRQYLLDAEVPLDTADAKLVVTDVHAGSIVLDLVAMAALAIPYVDPAVTVLDFGSYLATALRYFTNPKEKPPTLSPTAATAIGDALAPVAADGGSQLIISGSQVSGPVLFQPIFVIGAEEATEARKQIKRYVREQQVPEQRSFQKVLMWWYQARNDTAGRPAGDRAIIESISPRDVTTRIYDADLKAAMLGGPEQNPFREAFVVDVKVETINGKPSLYIIEALHDRIPIDVQQSLPETVTSIPELTSVAPGSGDESDDSLIDAKLLEADGGRLQPPRQKGQRETLKPTTRRDANEA
jgi:hypothetical protein